MAWRLNMVLSHLYPMAIPPEFRTKPKKRQKEFQMMQRPLPFAVVGLLADMKRAYRLIKQEGNWRQPYRREEIANAVQFDRGYNYEHSSKAAIAEAEAVLEAIGGVKTNEGHYQFDYNPGPVISEIAASGCIPDQKAHQFYPTPESLAKIAVDMAEIDGSHECLEPSAGTGCLADRMPKNTLCVEISGMHCEVLKAKGYAVEHADFLQWAEGCAKRFDRICLNPPFSEGRAFAHTQAAAKLLKPGGILVAILPASHAGKPMFDSGFLPEYSKPYENEFRGTSVSVTILKLRRTSL
jgi:hypothetical protein